MSSGHVEPEKPWPHAPQWPPLDSVPRCPKCGVWVIWTTDKRYCAGVKCDMAPVFEGKREPGKLYPVLVTEHIHRTCQGCGYVWIEACKDADKASGHFDTVPPPPIRRVRP